MAQVGFVVFLVGLTIAAWFASKVVPTEEGMGALDKIGAWGADAGLFFGVGLALMIIGGTLARRAQRPPKAKSGTDDAGKDTDGVAKARKLLDGMCERLDGLDASSLPEGSESLARELDTLLEDEVPDFLDHRKTLIDRLGLATFAEMIGSFAQMERGAARAWSAITDEAWSEVGPSLERARTSAKRAREVFSQS